MNIPSGLASCDPGIMIPRIPRFSPPPRLRDTIFIPHCHSDASPIYDWKRTCARAGVEHVSPRRDSHQVIRAIASATKVITESMHGAIIADAFRIPWKPVSLVENFNSFKWKDWADSLGMDFEITALPGPLIEKAPASRALSYIRKCVPRTLRNGRRKTPRIDAKRTGKRLASAIESLKTGDFYLSSEKELATRQDQILACLAGLRESYG